MIRGPLTDHPPTHNIIIIPRNGRCMTDTEPARDTGNILGDPKRALIAMVVPIAIGMLVQSLNNLVDAIWVSGVGTAALAATGVVFPFFFILIGIGNGLGVGASQAIARRIGIGDREGAGRVASQTLVIGVLVGIVIAIVFAAFPERIFEAAGAGVYIDEVLAYGVPIMVCSPIYLLSFIFSALLRSEGAAKMSMLIQIAGVAVHMVMDPILIYGLGMGVMGAAVASALCMVVASLLAVYIYMRRDTYVKISFRGFRFDRALDWDILRVGIPASVEMILVSISTLIMNILIETVDPINGVATYTTGWRILDLVMILSISFGSALVPISAAAYGQGNYRKIRTTYMYGLKYSVLAMVCLAAVAMVAAPWLVYLFTYSGDTVALSEEMTRFVRIGLLMMPFCSIGILTSSMFQSIGKGLWALLASALRNFIRIPVCVLIGSTLTGIWWSVTVGEMIGTCIVAMFGLYVLSVLRVKLGDRDVNDIAHSD